MRYDFDEIIDRGGTNSSKWRNERVLPMWVADMDFKAAPEILAAAQKRLDNGVFGYTTPPREWSEAVCGWWRRRHGVEFTPESAIFCSGVVPAMSSAVRKFTSIGDKIVVQAPVYHLFFSCIENNGRQVLINELKYENGEYGMDLADLESKLSDPLTTLFILCNPQNPVGKIWDRATLEKIGDMCEKYGVLVLSDEIHCDLTDPDARYVPYASVNEKCRQNSITCVAPTKAFNIAGFQTAAVIAPNPKIRARMSRAISTDEVGEGNAFAYVTAIAAFEKGEEWLDELRAYIYENKRLVAEFLKRENLGVRLVASDATYLLWLDCSRVCEDSTTLQQFLLKNARLWLNDGNAYRGGKGFLRMNIATQRARVQEGLNRLKSGILEFSSASC